MKMVNGISVILLLLLAGLFSFLALRALRNRRAWIKWPGVVLSGLLVLLLLAVTVVALLGFNKLNSPPYRYSVADVKIDLTQERVDRGERLAHICADCHSSKGSLPLDGSKDDFLADPSTPPIGSLWAPNLTPGGPLKDWSDGEIMRAIREGVDNKGRALVIMPSMAMHNLSDEDTMALVAYLRSQPAIDRPLPERNLNLLGALFFGAGMFPTSAQTPINSTIVAPAKGTADYGAYLVSAVGCRDCHGQNLDGVTQGNGPTGPNITVIVPTWKEEQFIQYFRTSADPITGRKISPDAMPVPSYNAALTDEELADIYNYLSNLPRVEHTTP
jgi:mono/diheme cytochrome c family protein